MNTLCYPGLLQVLHSTADMAAQNDSKSTKTHLPHLPDDDNRGAQMRSHYSVGENTDKLPSNLEELEAEREKRKKDYAQIAHEFVLLEPEQHKFRN